MNVRLGTFTECGSRARGFRREGLGGCYASPREDVRRERLGRSRDRFRRPETLRSSQVGDAAAAANVFPDIRFSRNRRTWASLITPSSTRKTGSLTRLSVGPRTGRYFRMSGVTTVASGQTVRALNIGMAERTPWARAM